MVIGFSNKMKRKYDKKISKFSIQESLNFLLQLSAIYVNYFNHTTLIRVLGSFGFEGFK